MRFNSTLSNVRPDVNWFELLVEGMSKSEGISDSLAKIIIDCWDIKREEAQEVIQKFKMNRVWVIAIKSDRKEE